MSSIKYNFFTYINIISLSEWASIVCVEAVTVILSVIGKTLLTLVLPERRCKQAAENI